MSTTPRASNAATAKARASCTRCYKRKKRCDRTLPACENCGSAYVRCSFLDDDHVQTAAYSVAYVRGLEKQLRELEGRTANTAPVQSPTKTFSDLNVQPGDSQRHVDQSMADPVATDWDHDIAGHHPMSEISSGMSAPPQQTAHHCEVPQSSGLNASPSFVEELKSLSFEATAERHLGSSSGISFAKLTQTVLRRLTPDLTDFVFVNGRSNSNWSRMLDDAQLDLSDPTLFESLNCSISLHPMLFDDFVRSSDLGVQPTRTALDLWSDEAHMNNLVDFYFAHSHTLYPILHRGEVVLSLQKLREDPQNWTTHSSLSLFRIWMVLAIGSTAYSSVSLTEESESRLYYDKALEHLEQAMEYGEMAALEVTMLQVSYSFFNQMGPNTWFLVGLAARMAVGMGLHASPTYAGMPSAMEQRRKRLFFSIYMMDRVVSIALGRPFALHDDDIDITPFRDLSDDAVETGDADTASPTNSSLLAVPLHILALRKIASKIARQVYSNRHASNLTDQERDKVISSLHQELIEWRRNMPFPIPDVNDRVPQLTSNWYDFNYYTHLAMLYRPSPLLPVMDSKRVKTLHEAASMSLRQAYSMHRQRRFAYNWLNLLSIFTSTLSLIYATTVQPNDLATVLKDTRAIADLELAVEMFDALALKFTAASSIRTMVAEVSGRYKDLRDSTDAASLGASFLRA